MILKKLLTLIIAISISFALVAQSDDETVQSRQAEISNIGQSLEKGLLDKGKARDRLRELRDKARSEIQRLGKLKTEHEEQIKALGEPQITGVVETPEVKERREELNTALAKIAASLTQARLNADDSSRLLNLISSDTRGAFREHLFKKDNGILSSNRWSHSLDILTISSNKLNKFVSDWYTTSKTSDALKNHLVKLIAIFGLLIVVFGPLRKRINLILKQKIKAGEYNENSHYHTTLIALFTRFIGVLVTGYTILIVISSTGLITESWHEKLSIVWLALLIWMIVDSLLVAIFVPKIPAKRLIPIDDSSALRARYLCSIAVTFLIVGHTSDLLMNQSQDFSGFNQVLNVIISFSIALLILMATRSEIKIFPEEIIESTTNNIGRKKVSRFYSRIWKYLKICAVPGALFIIGSLFLGYLNLAQFVSNRVVMIVVFVLFFWYFRHLLMSGLGKIEALLPKSHNEDESNQAIKNEEPQEASFWIGVVVDFSLLVTIAPLSLLLIGMDYSEVKVRIVDAFKGFTIGNITISLADIFTALLTFFVIVFVTRFLQKSLDARLFNRTGADAGFRNTFRTLLGYAGMLLAIFASIGVIGLDLSSLAIIAGALSVGIGFGLQSIVNNFVSGLILLFERPVKVGDWVVTSSGEGYIKRISVRSTEIETFNMASVIIPNSELISSSVQNWTHKDSGGRVVIPVGVSYGSDMELVRKILLQCVSDHPGILKYPESSVYFKDFGSSSLDVELRFFVNNIPDGIQLRSEIRFKILEAFRNNNIEIPFPQTDVHMKSLPAETKLENKIEKIKEKE